MVGLETPLLAMEHMYLLTEEIPDVIEYNEKTGKEFIHAVDFGGEIYMRQEGNGLLMGTYERRGKPWSTSQTPWDFGARLLTPDLERIAESLETASGTSRSLPRPASSRSSTARSPSPPTATRCLARFGACPATGRPARSWPACRRAAASDSPSPTGSSMAIQASTSGAWTSAATATTRRWRTPTRRCAKLLPSFPHHVPERVPPGRAWRTDLADLRPTRGEERGVRRRLRSGSRTLVPAGR